ncbi:hypothetical protein EDF68_11721 [Ochrobactrum sp. BH3]|nr:hypothetical protein EDF68_11721 [Ochrobactrum sp. BH3]
MNISNVIHKYDNKDLKVHTRILEPDNDDPVPSLLIEGNVDALRKLAEIIIAVTEDDKWRNLHIAPNGTGSIHFTKDSKVGLYINCIE